MKIKVLFTPNNLEDLYFTGKTSVAIDVLRATSTIIAALNNGAREVIPVATIDFATKFKGNTAGGMTLLGGERNTKMIEGFNLGNSPLEYKEEVVNGKSIILYTTNGTRAIVKAKFSDNLFICSFNNISSIARHLVKLAKDTEIICSGTNGFFSLEDVVCAGRLLAEILELAPETELLDSAKASLTLSKSFGKSIPKLLKETEHGKLLLENGFLEDLNYCSKINSIDIIPYFVSGSIKKLDLNNSDNQN
jgi:2-phosphosulfolactate phosphatase